MHEYLKLLSFQQLDDNTALLSETCDTFIHTLDECMKLTYRPLLQKDSKVGGFASIYHMKVIREHSVSEPAVLTTSSLTW